jgi:hypothetical protein
MAEPRLGWVLVGEVKRSFSLQSERAVPGIWSQEPAMGNPPASRSK